MKIKEIKSTVQEINSELSPLAATIKMNSLFREFIESVAKNRGLGFYSTWANEILKCKLSCPNPNCKGDLTLDIPGFKYHCTSCGWNA
jgi:hypothetical protein